ncbi:hypothetical protein HDU93_003082 [Gonapodya sp. JEL0774]|nr:hypothetical protein HDU93_003082 [Gonapodya sp. JEL0774]
MDIIQDSGAALSAVSGNFYRQYFSMMPLEPWNLQPITVGNSAITAPLGQVLLPITLASVQHALCLVVIKNIPYPILLGVDFLRIWHAVIDYDEGWIAFKADDGKLGTKTSVHIETGNTHCHNIDLVLNKDITIEGFHGAMCAAQDIVTCCRWTGTVVLKPHPVTSVKLGALAAVTTPFDVNQLVMLCYKESRPTGEGTKLISKWIGPYHMTEKESENIFQLSHISTEHMIRTQMSQMCHYQPWITHYVPNPKRTAALPPHTTAELAQPVSPEIAQSDITQEELGPDFQPTYVVKAILDKMVEPDTESSFEDELIDTCKQKHPAPNGKVLTRRAQKKAFEKHHKLLQAQGLLE